VALEGGDGSGKSTVAAALAEALMGEGHQVVTVREPGGTALGEVVRGLLLDADHVDPWAEVLLFAAQRAQLAREVVRPAIESGAWVISDRTFFSSIAYQGRARGMGESLVRSINETGLDGVVPGHVFVLDVDPALALERQHRADRIGGEGIEFQERVREAYAGLAEKEPDKVRILDGSLPVGILVEQMLEVIIP
jgi:dTMP kinase